MLLHRDVIDSSERRIPFTGCVWFHCREDESICRLRRRGGKKEITSSAQSFIKSRQSDSGCWQPGRFLPSHANHSRQRLRRYPNVELFYFFFQPLYGVVKHLNVTSRRQKKKERERERRQRKCCLAFNRLLCKGRKASPCQAIKTHDVPRCDVAGRCAAIYLWYAHIDARAKHQKGR